MIRTGIWKASQIRRASDANGFFGGTRRISIGLYEDLAQRSDDLVELLLLNYADSRGAYKRTYRSRFSDFDRSSLYILKEAFAADEPLKIRDAGVSDGRTAIDFFSLVSQEFQHLSYFASDYETEMHIKQDGSVSVASDSRGNIHEIVYPPFVFNLSKLESFRNYPLNYIALQLAQKRARRMLSSVPSRVIRIFCPDALRLASKDSRFLLGEHNLLNEFEGDAVHVIRAMNVLNSSYFNADAMGTIATHLHAALRDGGILIFGSNDDPDSEVRGGIYKRTNDGFDRLFASGKQMEMSAIIDGFKPPLSR